MQPVSFASRLFSSLTRRVQLRRQASQSSLIVDEESDFQSINSYETSVSYSSDNSGWHYCDKCKIGFASLRRQHWHTSLCKSQE